MGLRRLKKGTQANQGSEADDLAQQLSSMGLGSSQVTSNTTSNLSHNRFKQKILEGRPIADWSSSESSDERDNSDIESAAEAAQDPRSQVSGVAKARIENQRPRIDRHPDKASFRNSSEQARQLPEQADRKLKSRAQLPDRSSCEDEAGFGTDTGRSNGDAFEDAETYDKDALILGESQEYTLPGRIHSKLYAHQVLGVRWLFSLYASHSGGILGDDMGLGKTLQCSAFIAGLLHSKLIRRVLVVAPKTLLAQWRKELGVCSLDRNLRELAPNSSHHEREAELADVFRKPGILLTTYGMVQHNAELLSTEPDSRFAGSPEEDSKPIWDLIILDEGHKIKNPKTVIAQQLRKIPTAMAVIISGTPIQNNLMEMHALFDFVQPGLLGDQRFFKSEYEKVITRGNSKDATSRDREVANGRSKALRERCAPFFLRREKKEILTTNDAAVTKEGLQPPKPQQMGQKNDLVVWLRLKPQQQRIYEAFLNSQAVKDALNQSKSALAALNVLKKVCVHPHLLSERATDAVAKGGGRLAAGKRLVTDDDFIVNDSEEEYETASSNDEATDSGDDAEALDQIDEHWAEWGEAADIDEKLRRIVKDTGPSCSCKSEFIGALIQQLHANGHRTLIFSQSRVMLNILGMLLADIGLDFLRIDGSLSGPQREALVQQFQMSGDIPVFLLTSQVGGLGLTLTKADRVIIVDPAWNPSTDDQSVDRAYRIGQSKDVVVYRLISCGTVEEKIYRRQVFKGGLSRRGMKEGNPFQYFTQQDLRDLFRVEPEELRCSITQKQLHELHGSQRQSSVALDKVLSDLNALPGFAGVSDHDLLYSRLSLDPTAQSVGPAFPAASSSSRSGASEAARPQSRQQEAVLKSRKPSGYKQEWAGTNDISDLLAKSLNINDSKPSEAAKPPGPGWKDQTQKPASSRPKTTVVQLQEQVNQLKRLKQSNTLRLPDGGLQLNNKIAELERQIKACETDAVKNQAEAQEKLSAGASQVLNSKKAVAVKPEPVDDDSQNGAASVRTTSKESLHLQETNVSQAPMERMPGLSKPNAPLQSKVIEKQQGLDAGKSGIDQDTGIPKVKLEEAGHSNSPNPQETHGWHRSNEQGHANVAPTGPLPRVKLENQDENSDTGAFDRRQELDKRVLQPIPGNKEFKSKPKLAAGKRPGGKIVASENHRQLSGLQSDSVTQAASQAMPSAGSQSLLMKAMAAPFPDPQPQIKQEAPSVQLLEEQAAKMKKELRSMLEVLQLPDAKAKLGMDRYRQMKAQTHEMNSKRDELKKRIANMKAEFN